MNEGDHVLTGAERAAGHIGYIADVYFPNSTSGIGGIKNMRRIAREFEDMGFESHIFTRDHIDGAGVTRIGPPYQKRGYARKLLFSSALWKQRAAFLAMDLVYSQSASSIPFLYYLRRKGVPTIFDCRNSFVRGGKILGAFHLFTMLAFAPSHVTFVDKLSKADYSNLLRRPDASSTYIPVPVDVVNVPPNRVPSQARSVLFATQLTSQKGFPAVLEAFESLWQSGENVVLTVAGDGPLRPQAEAAAARWPGRLRLLGMVPFENVQSLLAESDILVQPSLFEGVSVSVLEALSCGVPAIATTTGGMKELADADVIERVKPKDAAALACAIRRLASDASRRQDLSERGWAYVKEHHDTSICLERFRSIFSVLQPKLRRNADPF